jgi:uncharacterized protein YlzI (FlbEa/FlbD family)
MTTYVLLDGTQISVNEQQICTVTETDKTKVITMSNGMRLEVKK